MGRVFTIKGGQSVVASATETCVRWTGHANYSYRVLRARVNQRTHKTSEQYLFELQEASAAGTDTAATPTPRDGISVAQGTAGINSSVEPTYTAGKKHMERAFNSLIGLNEMFDEKEAPTFKGGTIVGAKITTPSGTTTFTPEVELDVEELP
jgi:hypothetical protein